MGPLSVLPPKPNLSQKGGAQWASQWQFFLLLHTFQGRGEGRGVRTYAALCITTGARGPWSEPPPTVTQPDSAHAMVQMSSNLALHTTQVRPDLRLQRLIICLLVAVKRVTKIIWVHQLASPTHRTSFSISPSSFLNPENSLSDHEEKPPQQ